MQCAYLPSLIHPILYGPPCIVHPFHVRYTLYYMDLHTMCIPSKFDTPCTIWTSIHCGIPSKFDTSCTIWTSIHCGIPSKFDTPYTIWTSIHCGIPSKFDTPCTIWTSIHCGISSKFDTPYTMHVWAYATLFYCFFIFSLCPLFLPLGQPDLPEASQIYQRPARSTRGQSDLPG